MIPMYAFAGGHDCGSDHAVCMYTMTPDANGVSELTAIFALKAEYFGEIDSRAGDNAWRGLRIKWSLPEIK